MKRLKEYYDIESITDCSTYERDLWEIIDKTLKLMNNKTKSNLHIAVLKENNIYRFRLFESINNNWKDVSKKYDELMYNLQIEGTRILIEEKNKLNFTTKDFYDYFNKDRQSFKFIKHAINQPFYNIYILEVHRLCNPKSPKEMYYIFIGIVSDYNIHIAEQLMEHKTSADNFKKQWRKIGVLLIDDEYIEITDKEKDIMSLKLDELLNYYGFVKSI